MSAGLPSLRKINLMNTLVQLLYWAAFSAFAGCQAALLSVRAAGHPQSTH